MQKSIACTRIFQINCLQNLSQSDFDNRERIRAGMSLDISLKVKKRTKRIQSSGIFVRQNGQTIEVSEKEWREKNPGREPVRYIRQTKTTNEVFSINITHNLGLMAEKAGIYFAMWRPEEKGWKYAKDIADVLERGLNKLTENPIYFEQYNPESGWGTYEALVDVLNEYVIACRQYPDAEIVVSR